MKYDILFNALKDAVEPDLDKLGENAEMSDASTVRDEFNDKMQTFINKKNKRIHLPSSFRKIACIAVTFVIVFVCSVNVDAYKEKSFEFLPIVAPEGLILYTYGIDDQSNAARDGDYQIPRYELTGLDEGYELTYFNEDPCDISYTYEKGDSSIMFEQTHYSLFSGALYSLEISKKYWIKHNGREYFVEEMEADGITSTNLIWGIDDCVFDLFGIGLSFDEVLQLAENIRKV